MLDPAADDLTPTRLLKIGATHDSLLLVAANRNQRLLPPVTLLVRIGMQENSAPKRRGPEVPQGSGPCERHS